MTSLFEDKSLFEQRFHTDYHSLVKTVRSVRQVGATVVLTSGSFDLLHIGHAKYLEAARELGDFLVVGVDSDERVSLRKGPDRPVVPEMERAEIVAHQRGVGAVVLKSVNDSKWLLIGMVMPDVLVTPTETYTSGELVALRPYVGYVATLPRMAETSTSARIRNLTIKNNLM